MALFKVCKQQQQIEERGIYLQVAVSVQKGHVKCTIEVQEAQPIYLWCIT